MQDGGSSWKQTLGPEDAGGLPRLQQVSMAESREMSGGEEGRMEDRLDSSLGHHERDLEWQLGFTQGH